MSHRHTLRACPRCRAPIDTATHPSGKDIVPEPGDLSVCLYCAAPLMFGPELALELVDIETLEPEAKSELQRVCASVRRFLGGQT